MKVRITVFNDHGEELSRTELSGPDLKQRAIRCIENLEEINSPGTSSLELQPQPVFSDPGSSDRSVNLSQHTHSPVQQPEKQIQPDQVPLHQPDHTQQHEHSAQLQTPARQPAVQQPAQQQLQQPAQFQMPGQQAPMQQPMQLQTGPQQTNAAVNQSSTGMLQAQQQLQQPAQFLMPGQQQPMQQQMQLQAQQQLQQPAQFQMPGQQQPMQQQMQLQAQQQLQQQPQLQIPGQQQPMQQQMQLQAQQQLQQQPQLQMPGLQQPMQQQMQLQAQQPLQQQPQLQMPGLQQPMQQQMQLQPQQQLQQPAQLQTGPQQTNNAVNQSNMGILHRSISDASLTISERLELFLKYEFPRTWASSQEIQQQYEKVYGDIKLSTVSTYLSRMYRKKLLERRGNRTQREYIYIGDQVQAPANMPQYIPGLPQTDPNLNYY